MKAIEPADIDRSGLVPRRYELQQGGKIEYFPDRHTVIVRIDIVFNGGYAYQGKKFLCASAIELITSGTRNLSSGEIDRFMDYRGISIEKSNDLYHASLTVYSLAKHLPELLPMLREMIDDTAYPWTEFDIFKERKREYLLASQKKTSFQARILYNEHLYGAEHPYGVYGEPSDLDLLTTDDLKVFHREHFKLADAQIIVSGNVDDSILALIERELVGPYSGEAGSRERGCKGSTKRGAEQRAGIATPKGGKGRYRYDISDAVQRTIRIGRILPMSWSDPRLVRFMLLSTALGGYFGSRLMSNLREEKGYTYGIYSQTQVDPGGIGLIISTDVASEKAEESVGEIMREMSRLRSEAMEAEELELVRRTMLGDFMRSIDGSFERAERYIQMRGSGITERFTEMQMAALEENAVTPEELQEMANFFLQEDAMLVVY